MSSIVLKRNGFYRQGLKKIKKIDINKPENNLLFLNGWNKPFTIRDDVICGDLFGILLKTNALLFQTIESLVDCSILPHLVRAFDPLPDDYVDSSKLTAVEVYRIIDISDYDKPGKQRIQEDYTCAHGIGKAYDADFGGNNTYAIEFTPWNELIDLKLTIKKMTSIEETSWKKGKKIKVISNGGNAPWNFSNKHFVAREIRELGNTMTLGEFLSGLFAELAFFSSPDQMKKESAILKERVDDLKKESDKKKK